MPNRNTGKILLTLPVAMVKVLDRIAYLENKSRAQVIRDFLDESIRKRGYEPPDYAPSQPDGII